MFGLSRIYNKISRKSLFLANFVILCVLIFNLFNFISFSNAQTDDDPLTVYSTFNFTEFGEQQGQILNASALEFTIPPDTWDLTNIELNFTNIKFKRNIYGIEDAGCIHAQATTDSEGTGFIPEELIVTIKTSLEVIPVLTAATGCFTRIQVTCNTAVLITKGKRIKLICTIRTEASMNRITSSIQGTLTTYS